MILVVGATGLLGIEVCRRLSAAKKPVRALVRAGSAREVELQKLRVEVVHGDLRAREAIDRACHGVTAVISTATAMSSSDNRNSLRAVDRDGQLALVDAARRNGARHFVYVSISPNYRELAPLMRYKREVERAVRDSGMQWTILQPSNFMEIWLSSFLGWDFSKNRATIFGSGAAPVSWISLHNVAEYCVLALDDPRMANRDIPLGGPEALAPNDVLRIFEDVSGKQYRAKRIPRVIPAMLSRVLALFNERQASGMSLGAQSADGDRIDSSLQSDLPVELTSVREYAQKVVPA